MRHEDRDRIRILTAPLSLVCLRQSLILSLVCPFKVADMRLYIRLCPSVRPSVTLYVFNVSAVLGLTAPAQLQQ